MATKDLAALPGLAKCMTTGHKWKRLVHHLSGHMTAWCPQCRTRGEWSEFKVIAYQEPSR